MKKSYWFYYAACLVVPHIMLVVGLIFLSLKDREKKVLGKNLCIASGVVIAAGSLVYYVFFTPMFGLD